MMSLLYSTSYELVNKFLTSLNLLPPFGTSVIIETKEASIWLLAQER